MLKGDIDRFSTCALLNSRTSSISTLHRWSLTLSTYIKDDCCCFSPLFIYFVYILTAQTHWAPSSAHKACRTHLVRQRFGFFSHSHRHRKAPVAHYCNASSFFLCLAALLLPVSLVTVCVASSFFSLSTIAKLKSHYRQHHQSNLSNIKWCTF